VVFFFGSKPLLSPARAQLRRHSFGKLVVEGRSAALHAAEDLQHRRDLVANIAHGKKWVGVELAATSQEPRARSQERRAFCVQEYGGARFNSSVPFHSHKDLTSVQG
jgi:hypothetical protein